jgi:hypothetical protein
MLAARDEGMYVSPKRLGLAVFLEDHWLPAIESTVLPTTFHSYHSMREAVCEAEARR